MTDDRTKDKILTSVALLGGGFLFVELLKLFGKKTTFYSCDRCRYDQLEFGTTMCPNCKSKLKWNNQ